MVRMTWRQQYVAVQHNTQALNLWSSRRWSPMLLQGQLERLSQLTLTETIHTAGMGLDLNTILPLVRQFLLFLLSVPSILTVYAFICSFSYRYSITFPLNPLVISRTIFTLPPFIALLSFHCSNICFPFIYSSFFLPVNIWLALLFISLHFISLSLSPFLCSPVHSTCTYMNYPYRFQFCLSNSSFHTTPQRHN